MSSSSSTVSSGQATLILDTNNNRNSGNNVRDSMSSPAVEELDDWRLTLQHLAADSNAWHQWNESVVYEVHMPEGSVRRGRYGKQVSLDDLKIELAQHEEQLQQAEAEDEEVMQQQSVDTMTLDQLSDEISILVSDLPSNDQEEEEDDVDRVSRETERLTLDDDMGRKVEEALRELHLSVMDQSAEKRC